MNQLNCADKMIIEKVYGEFGRHVRKKHIKIVSSNNNLSVDRVENILKYLDGCKNKYGTYDLKFIINIPESKLEEIQSAELTLVPKKDPLFIPFGNYKDIQRIISSGIFYPIYISGLSGNGKTTMVEQICASTDRGLVRVNITHETDEDNLLGGFRLLNGDTVWHDGPVIRAMKTGSVLLLDEVDLNSIKILCLQPILEGKGILLKRIDEYVKPKDGFNIIATANTKGRGNDNGKFVGSNIMNEAFLERFSLTFEQDYPTCAIETKILEGVFNNSDIDDKDFCDTLVKWANAIRILNSNGGTDEIITTRRLVHIARAYSIFHDKNKAIQLCINRFDENTRVSFLDMYEKLSQPTDPNIQFDESIDENQKKLLNEESENDDIATLLSLERYV